MNGPTIRRCTCGSARRTVNPPRSAVRGTITTSIASQAGASPAAGSFAGKKLIGSPLAKPRRRESHMGSWGRETSGRQPPAWDILLHVEGLRPGRVAGSVEGDLFDPRLRLTQELLAAALEHLAALVDRDRFLERNIAAFELLYDRFELGQRLFEGQLVRVGIHGVGHQRSCRRIGSEEFSAYALGIHPRISAVTCAATERARPSRS